MLLHCPGDPSTRAETWRALEDAVNKVRVAHVALQARRCVLMREASVIWLSPGTSRKFWGSLLCSIW